MVVGVRFSINPSINSGHIICDKDIPTNQYLYVEIGTHCKAEHNTGFQFSSWTENLGENSTKNITPVTKTSFWYTPIINWFGSTMDALGLKTFQDDASATFSVTKFGNFTANFDKVPPPLPPEYLAPLYGIIITTLVGSWFIPTTISWFKSKKQQGRLHHHIRTIDSLNSSERSHKNNENKVLLEIQTRTHMQRES